jgi:hypothetical protein
MDDEMQEVRRFFGYDGLLEGRGGETLASVSALLESFNKNLCASGNFFCAPIQSKMYECAGCAGRCASKVDANAP